MAAFSQRYEAMFERLDAKGEGAFVPFVTIGDPNPELSLQIINTLVENGADAWNLASRFLTPLQTARPFREPTCVASQRHDTGYLL